MKYLHFPFKKKKESIIYEINKNSCTKFKKTLNLGSNSLFNLYFYFWTKNFFKLGWRKFLKPGLKKNICFLACEKHGHVFLPCKMAHIIFVDWIEDKTQISGNSVIFFLGVLD